MSARRVVVAMVMTVLAVPAYAQAPGGFPIGYRVSFHVDQVSLAATETFDAIVNTSSASGWGVGGDVRVWKGVFGRFAMSKMETLIGARAFIVNGRPVTTGIPITIDMRPLEIGVGWQQGLGRRQRIIVYGGVSALKLKYTETSDFAGPGEDVDRTFGGRVVFGGIDVGVWRWVVAGIEAQYRTVPDAIGTGGVSEAFVEDDLGGSALRIVIGIRR